MADLRIVDAPVLLQESITDDVKMPTGGLGNYAIRLGDIVRYVVQKEQLASKNYVDTSSKGVKDSLDEHIVDKANPHQVTKAQVGLGNVNNTADVDKPVSNAVRSAIITATNDMATKTYVNSKDGDLTTLTTTDKTNLVKAINEVVGVKADKATTLVGYGISDAYTKSEIDTNYGGVKTLYDKNVVAGAGANGWTASLVQDASGKTQQQINDASVKNGDYGTVLATTVALKVNYSKPSFKFGLKSNSVFDDNNNNFRGLPNPTDPWADENTGIGSTMLGRDNATYAYLSFANGHGCSTYGVASIANGAGASTGNADAPNSGAGYCAVAFGKDVMAKGRTAVAHGERTVAESDHSYSGGFESFSGKGLATHPNEEGGQGIVSDGDCAYSYGWRAKAFGSFAKAFGDFVESYNGALVIGRGINAGTKLINALSDSLALGMGVDIPTILLKKGDGTIGSFGKLGINTKNPKYRIDANIKDGDLAAITVEKTGTGRLSMRGELSTGDAEIFGIEYTNPNAGQAYGVTNFYQNSQNFATIAENGQINLRYVLSLDSYLLIGGNKVIGGQQAAIADSTGTAADNARAINAILAALRGHGLIAS